jgi:GNAT superfamily N-acetyltransferase
MSKQKMESHIVVVQATVADLPAVVELCMQVEEQHEGYWALRWKRKGDLREGYLGWLTRRVGEPRMLIAVAREAGAAGAGEGIAGMILVTIEKEIPIYAHSEYAFVQDMAVVEAYRRRGVGQRLLEFAADWARPQGLNQLRLMVANQNPAARATFEKAGFRATYQEMVLPLTPG